MQMRVCRQEGNPNVSIDLVQNGQLIPVPLAFEIQVRTQNGTWISLMPNDGKTYWLKWRQPMRINLHGITISDASGVLPKEPVEN